MKKIELICVGKIKEPYLKEAIAEYQKRLTRFCNLSIIELKDEGYNIAVATAKESAAIATKISNDVSILLDIEGEQITSKALASYIDKAFTNGATKVQFIIGGSHGVDSAIKNAATKKISFGRITYPHQLIRVVCLEQIYRSMCILANVPYHK